MKEILNYLSKTYWKLSEEAMQYILQKCDELSKEKGEILLKEGTVCQHVWFIKKGMLRAYQDSPPNVDRPGKTHTNWHLIENDIATSVVSFVDGLPSEEEIVAEEDVIVFQMSKKELFAGIERYPGMAILTLLIVFKYYRDTRFFETCLRMNEPQLIYEWMLAVCPQILQRALQGNLATFLGVSEPIFRDIKSGKYKKKRK